MAARGQGQEWVQDVAVVPDGGGRSDQGLVCACSLLRQGKTDLDVVGRPAVDA